MDPKKKRNSILKKETTTKLKRISFSVKKSVRVYSGEEEAKAWNNSYEESDNADPENQTTAFLEASTRGPNTPISNISGQLLCPKELRRSLTPLSTTMEFINKTYHADILHIENSVDLSLCDRECLRPSITFSLDESERNKLISKKYTDSNERQSLPTSMEAEFHKRSALELGVNKDLLANKTLMETKETYKSSSSFTNIKEVDTKNYAHNEEQRKMKEPPVKGDTINTSNSDTTDKGKLEEHNSELSMEISNDSISMVPNLVESEFKNLLQNTECEDKQNILKLDLNISGNSKEKQNKTIIFGANGLIIANKSQVENIDVCNNGNTSFMELDESGLHKSKPVERTEKAKDFSKHIEVPQVLSECGQKGAVPKLVVVRKKCTPLPRKKNNAKMQSKVSQKCLSEKENETDHGHKSSYRNIDELVYPTLVDTESHLNMSSPLFSAHIGKKCSFNFRKLNDEIEQGHIKPFPNTKSKSQKSQDSMETKELTKQEEAVHLGAPIASHLKLSGKKDDSMGPVGAISVTNKDVDIVELDNLNEKEVTNVIAQSGIMMRSKCSDGDSDSRSGKKLRRTIYSCEMNVDSSDSCNDIDIGSHKVEKLRKTIYSREMDIDSSLMNNETKRDPINETGQLECSLCEDNVSGVDCCISISKKNLPQLTKNPTKIEAEFRVENNKINAVEDIGKSQNNFQYEGTDFARENFGLQVNTELPVKNTVCNSKRATVYFVQDNDIDLDNSIGTEIEKVCDSIVDAKEQKSKVVPKGSRKTLHFTKENYINLDYSVVETSPQSEKITTSEDSVSLQLNKARITNRNKTINYSDSNEMLDISEPGSVRKVAATTYRLLEGTPHRSIIEFERLERETRQDPDTSVEKKAPMEAFLNSFSAEIDKNNSLKCKSGNFMGNCNRSSYNLENLAKSNVQCRITTDSNIELSSPSARRKDFSDKRKLTIYETVPIEIDESGLKSLQNEEVSNREKSIEKELTTSLVTPVVNFSPKRKTLNLTPMQPVAKKRLTRLFNTCIDKSSSFTNNEELLTDGKNNMDSSAVNVTERATNVPKSGDYEVAVNFISNSSPFANKCLKKLSTALSPLSIHRCELPTDGEADFPVPYHDVGVPVSYECDPEHSHVAHNIASAKNNNSFETRCIDSSSSSSFNQSLQAIEIPRRISKRNEQSDQLKHSVVELKQLRIQEPHQCEKMLHDDFCQYQMAAKEDAITISDVSAHYSQFQKNNNDCNPDTTLQFSKLCEDTTSNNIANIKKIYVDLNTSSDEIDKTKLSLVETFVDEDYEEVVDVEMETEKAKEQSDNNIALPEEQHEIISQLPNVSLMCRKCKRCQKTLNESTLNASDSFVLPKAPSILDRALNRLKEIRSKPTISEVSEYVRREFLEKSFHVGDVKLQTNICRNEEESNFDEVDNFLSELKSRLKRTEIAIATKRSKENIISLKPFFYCSNIRLSLPNWIFDDQMEARNIYTFTHRKIITSSVLLMFLRTENFEREVDIKEIKLTSSHFANKNWKPFHHILDFQLRLELPYDLQSLCHSSDEDGVLAMLKEIDRLCLDIESFGRCFWNLVCNEKSKLIRQGNSIYIRKVVRKSFKATEEGFGHIRETVFDIEVTNMRKICFNNITAPPLHFFQENIQDLPSGLDFLALFLKNPLRYLKIIV